MPPSVPVWLVRPEAGSAVVLDGRGVAKNEAEAAKWFRKAADAGNEKAKQTLQKLEKK